MTQNDNNNPNKNVINSEYLKYKTSITGSTYNVDARITNAIFFLFGALRLSFSVN